MAASSKLFGNPSGIPYILRSTDTEGNSNIGGNVQFEVASAALKYGDLVFRLPGGRVGKSLESSVYPAFFVGVVVGGSVTGYAASSDSALVGTQVSAAGERVLVQIDGVAYVPADVSLQVRLGDPIIAGTTTAGRALGGSTASYSNITAGLAIKAGASALVKSVNAFTGFASGLATTATAANLDGAALSGTTANAKFAIYVFRVATDGTTVTSAKSADADTLAAVVWPTAGTSALITYGFVVINPTGTGDFVGGTTALDDATVVPNAKYYNLVGQYKRLGVALSTPATGAGAAFLMQIRG